MLKKIITNVYFLAGVFFFLFITVLGLWLDFSLTETLTAALVLSMVAIASEWWRRHIG